MRGVLSSEKDNCLLFKSCAGARVSGICDSQTASKHFDLNQDTVVEVPTRASHKFLEHLNKLITDLSVFKIGEVVWMSGQRGSRVSSSTIFASRFSSLWNHIPPLPEIDRIINMNAPFM